MKEPDAIDERGSGKGTKERVASRAIDAGAHGHTPFESRLFDENSKEPCKSKDDRQLR
jgi:hypothetical protein